MSKQIQSGFTLVELIVVMAIMATIMAIAAPNVSEMMAQFRLNSSVGALTTDLNVARTEAIKSGQPVILICQGDPCAYTPISWTGGWLICYSTNSTSCDASTTLRVNPIRSAGKLPQGQILNAGISTTVAFYPTGYSNATTAFMAGADLLPGLKNIQVTRSGSITSLGK